MRADLQRLRARLCRSETHRPTAFGGVALWCRAGLCRDLMRKSCCQKPTWSLCSSVRLRRVINANALDLSLFQFDYDLSFSTLFFNADRSIYGRYGSWSHQKGCQAKPRQLQTPRSKASLNSIAVTRQ